MDFSEIFNIQFIILCLVVTAVTHVLKAFVSPIKAHKYVKTVLLPALPIIVGSVAGYILSTIVLGLISGLLSSLIYAKVKAFIKAS